MFRSYVTASVDAVLNVVLAPTCAACTTVLASPTAGPVCPACWSGVVPAVPPLCAICGDPLPSWRVLTPSEAICARCRRIPPAFECARAAGDYDGSLREIIHAFKYDGRRSLAAPLARLMRDEGSSLLRDADYVVPVPLHPWRRLRRGFNQAEELAKRLEVPMIRALWRTRATVPQTGLRPAERRRNVRDAFVLSPWITSRRARLVHSVTRAAGAVDLSGKSVVLVDDVRTTGATLDACARALADAGARTVRALTIARATRSR